MVLLQRWNIFMNGVWRIPYREQNPMKEERWVGGGIGLECRVQSNREIYSSLDEREADALKNHQLALGQC